MTRRTIVIVALFFGVAYAVSSAIRGHVLAGIVTGVRGAVLFSVVVGGVQHHHAAQRRRREQRDG
jgi:hypothetical protein